MRNLKRILSCLLVLAMLSSMAIVVSAEETNIIEAEVQNSITIAEDAHDDSGKGLAFRIQMNVKGAKMNAWNEFINTNATATVDGVEYKVVKMGAVMANQATDIANMDNLTLADVTGHFVLDIPAKYLCDDPTADFCEFAVRITNLPEKALGRAIGCRPYIVLEKDGEETIIYGDSDIATYNDNYYASKPEETPVLDISAPVAIDKYLSVTAASAEYVAYETTSYVEAFKVSLTLENTSAAAITSAGDYVGCSLKDADGNVLGSQTVAIDVLNPGESMDVMFYAPIGTSTIVPTDINLNYVPDIILPAIGSDIDVTKKKNRIRVSAAEASFNEDGTIHVSLTFKNYTSNWITEETDYVQYTYYNAAGTKIKTVTLYIGVIDTKKHPTKTFEFDLPANAASVKITKSKIVYWTEWA